MGRIVLPAKFCLVAATVTVRPAQKGWFNSGFTSEKVCKGRRGWALPQSESAFRWDYLDSRIKVVQLQCSVGSSVKVGVVR